MTGAHTHDLETRAALEALRSWVTTEQLLGQLQRRLCPADDIGRAIADELGVTIDDWHGYHAIRHAADRYQHTRHPTTPNEGAPIS
jgi:hypothetical protein